MKFITCLLLVFAVALSGCKTASKAEKEKKAALDKKAKANLREESSDTDFQAFVWSTPQSGRGARYEHARHDDDPGIWLQSEARNVRRRRLQILGRAESLAGA